MTQTIAVPIPATHWWTANSRLHHMERARRTREVRKTAAIIARALTPMDRANVHVLVHSPAGRLRDADNAAPMVKACIDGIVDSGALPDDDRHHRPVTAYEMGDKTGVSGIYRLTIRLTPLEDR